jgi:hypothetical protein
MLKACSLGIFKKRNISMVFLKTQPMHGILKNTTYAWRFKKHNLCMAFLKTRRECMPFLKTQRSNGIFKNVTF